MGQSERWTGLYTLLALDEEICKVQLPHKSTSFRLTTVKPFLRTENEEEGPAEPSERPVEQPTEPTEQLQPVEPIHRKRGRPRKLPLATKVNTADITVFVQDTTPFTDSRQSEVNGLLEKGIFEVVSSANLPRGVRIFNSRFVDKIKHPGTSNAFEKSRLVVQAYNDQGKDLILI